MLTLAQTNTAVNLGNTASFLASGGTPPYTYSVLPGGQGGVIDPVTGIYSSPSPDRYNSEPNNASDTIQAVDSTNTAVVSKILVGPPLILFCDIISTVMKLPAGRCWLWDQKVFMPVDRGLYVPIMVSNVKTFANSYTYDPVSDVYRNFVNVAATLDIHVVSKDNTAVFKKEILLAALVSPYSIQQQEANGFSIGRIPPGGAFNDISDVDGGAIPYHFVVTLKLFYSVGVSFNTEVFTSFPNVSLVVNP